MGIIDDAVALETKAEAAYRSAAAETCDAGAKRILILLADEERAHAAALREMEVEDAIKVPNLLEAAKTWVRGAIEGGALTLSPDASLRQVLQRAMEIEQATETFYREQAAATDDRRLVALLSTLADAECNLFAFVSSLVEYYDRPNEWVENAEFGLRPEY